jgi:monoamine oxidase
VVAGSVSFEGGQIAPEQMHIMRNTHTWMHNSIKFGWVSDAAYWHQQGFAGTFFSQVGPITEMYDHTNAEGTFFSLKGFLSGGVSAYSLEERLQMVQAQMAACMPFWSDKAFEYVEKDWSKDRLLNPVSMDLLPHQNNGHPLLRKPIIEGKVWLGGTECASVFPGYMDGAVQRAKELSKDLQVG